MPNGNFDVFNEEIVNMFGTFIGETNYFNGSIGHNRLIVNLRGVFNGTTNFGVAPTLAPTNNRYSEYNQGR